MKKVYLLTIGLIILIFAGCGQNSNVIGELTVNNYEESQAILLSDNDINYSGDGISTIDCSVMISRGGSYVLSGTLSDGNIIVDTEETVFLALNGVNITSARSSAILFTNSGKAVIEISEGTENYLSDADGKEGKVKKNDGEGDKNAVIYSSSGIELHGSGKLFITGNNRGGIHSNDSVYIFSGVISISANNQGIFAQNKLVVNDGEISIERSKEGMECKGELIINDGIIKITSKDDAINAEKNLVINDGYIYAESNGDGFDSNGNMAINGGEIFVFAGNGQNSAIDVSNGSKIGSFIVNGGTIIAAGGDMKVKVDAMSKQSHAWIYPSYGETVSVYSESGEFIIEFTFPKKYDLLFISTDKIKSGEKYSIRT